MKKLRNLLILLMLFFLVLYLYQPWTGLRNLSLETHDQNNANIIREQGRNLINAQGKILRERIIPPEGFARIEAEKETFGNYLQSLPLKPHGAPVLYYNGREKIKDVHSAVIDMEIGDRDLQQCADAVIRLRAEYLYQQEKYDEIQFNFVSGFTADYSTWMDGNRINVDGSQVTWVKRTGYNNEYDSFRKYLDMVFAYAGTASLTKELSHVAVEEMSIGDVFIIGGSPGHCVIVVDMAENKSTGEKLFLLAQSYMPAQDIHILKNPLDLELSPWYPADFGNTLITPEWQFDRGDLKRFA